jgi:uncharacterized protein (TIGR00255 family)
MTGYGNAVAEFGGKKIHVEVKSLNSKALDLSTRIAPLYREKEMEIRSFIQGHLERGKVDLSIWVEKEAALTADPVNVALASQYYNELTSMASTLNIDTKTTDWMTLLLRMPDIMSHTEVEVLSDEEWQVVNKTLCEAVGNLIDFRKQEGQALQRKFTEKIENIRNLLLSIAPYEQSRVEKIRQRIIDGLSQLSGVDYDSNRLEQEMIYYIEKLDISEEKQRLTNHLDYFLQTMNEGTGGQGKKLGFIAQEMGREINTTGSKSNQAEMQNIVVQMKDELEQIKEQVLNVM